MAYNSRQYSKFSNSQSHRFPLSRSILILVSRALLGIASKSLFAILFRLLSSTDNLDLFVSRTSVAHSFAVYLVS